MKNISGTTPPKAAVRTAQGRSGDIYIPLSEFICYASLEAQAADTQIGLQYKTPKGPPMFGFMRQAAPALPVADAVQQVADGEMTLIDIRDHAELASSGKARGALHIPMMRLADMADPRHPDFHPDLKQDKPIALYCASGARSNMAAGMLRRMGYTDVHNLGGLAHWMAAGGPIERG